ncbi:MAG: HD domain-containing protein [Clostridia bacterium]|nr:HD domain-containing protein [Clostridia bacterium]
MANLSPATNVLEFYFLANKLKEVIRSGWKQWNVSRDRLESVAEHVFSTCTLAIAIESEYHYNIDLSKVLMMLVLHETEEILIPDITPCDGVSAEEKVTIGHKAVEQVLAHLGKSDAYKSLIFEFDAHQTPESIFAYMCDKLDADLMSLYYDKDESCTLTKATTLLQETPLTVELSDGGRNSMGECFRLFEYELNRLDPNFFEILNAAKDFLQNK